MSERQPGTPPVEIQAEGRRPSPAAPEVPSRADWTLEDDELLLLDEIEESPDDERIGDLV